MASRFAPAFLRDADEILAVMRSGRLSSGGEEAAVELARALHSLKSGAAFLGWTDLETEVHALENRLVSGNASDHDWGGAAEILSDLVDTRRDEAAKSAAGSRRVPRAVFFTAHEMRILDESKTRGEQFYRLTCTIDPSEPLPYPRAYLLASRLETGMTLVKSEPPMDDSQGDFSRPTFWFTTDAPESDIYAAADVDQVGVAELTILEYQDVLEKGEAPSEDASGRRPEDEDADLMVDRNRYSEAMELAEELAWRLERQPGSHEAELSTHLQQALETLAFRPMEPMLREIGRAVGRLAERRGISARFEWSLASGGLDAASMETFGEIIRQLVRNSLRHGIEPPEDRQASGKAGSGTLKLVMERSGRTYTFRYEDDGRGIDEDAVMEKNIREGGGEGSLLDILCSRGFTTAEDSDVDGGRGMGLDMIRHLLQREFDTELILENKPGRGLAFSWSMPDKHMRRPYLVFVSEGQSWAIPADSVKRRGVMDSGKVNASGQAYEIGGGLVPMVGPLGLRAPGTCMPYVLEIQHRGRRAALLVDDLLSEEPWSSDDLMPADPAGPWCRSMKDARDGIPILSPAVVYAGEIAQAGEAGDTR